MYRQVWERGEISTTQIERVNDSAFIPFDLGNADYQIFLRWLAEGNQPLPPLPLPLFTPASLSRRQFYQILAMKDLIKPDEALAVMQHGVIPERFEHLLATFSAEEQFAARMLLLGASEFQREHPLVEKFAEDQGISKEQVDAIWREGSTL